VLSTAVEDTPDGHTQTHSTLASADSRDVTNGATVLNDSTNSSSSIIDVVSQPMSDLAITPQPVSILSTAEPRRAALSRGNIENIQHQFNSVAEAIEFARQSGQPLSKEQLTSLFHSKLSPALQVRSGFEHTVIRELGAIHEQGATTQQIALKVLELQKQMNDRLILIQKKTEAILTQQVELAEYPMPRRLLSCQRSQQNTIQPIGSGLNFVFALSVNAASTLSLREAKSSTISTWRNMKDIWSVNQLLFSRSTVRFSC